MGKGKRAREEDAAYFEPRVGGGAVKRHMLAERRRVSGCCFDTPITTVASITCIPGITMNVREVSICSHHSRGLL